MNFEEVVRMAKMAGSEKQLSLTTETFNNLSEATFRVNNKDNIVVGSNNFDVEISMKEELTSNCGTFCAKIERISEVFPMTKLIRKDVYVKPEGECQIIILWQKRREWGNSFPFLFGYKINSKYIELIRGEVFLW